MITRRQTLHRIVMGGVAVFVGAVPGTRAIAAPLPRRREINGLALNDPIVETLREGVKILKARGAGDGPSWNDFAAIHGTASAFNKCPHRNWYFLPWHRAYLLSYERMIRSVTGNSSFALPYWDWAANRTVPQAFSEPQHNGQDNPLFVSTRDNSYSVPDTVAGPAVMDQIFTQTNFELFASSRPSGQNNTNASWITSSTGTQGKLEQTPHNLIHGNLGGFMGQGNSPRDPIFLMHHGNIDRIWWRWNCRGGVNTSDSLWRDMPFTDHFFNPDGTKATFRPSDLLSVAALGYSYGLCLRRVQWPLLRATANLRLATIFRAGRASRVEALSGGQRVRMQRRDSAGPAVEAVGAAPPRSLRTAFANLSARPPAISQLRPEQRVSQVVALVHDLTPPSDAVEVLVFAGTSPIPPVNDPRDPRFVTIIGFFGSDAHHRGGVSSSVDLTDHLRRIGADSDQVHVRLVARARPRADVPARSVQETVERAQVEVVIV